MILVLSVSEKGNRLCKGLQSIGEDVEVFSDYITVREIERYLPELVISHGYDKIISKDVINKMQGHIINAHPSVLPYNRGHYSNFWSFIYNTPKGFTIHKVDENLDTGDILMQQEISFDPNSETFQSTYNVIEDMMYKALFENIQTLKKLLIPNQKQTGIGSYHSMKKFLAFKKSIPFEWNTNIGDFLSKNDYLIKSFISKWVD